jgi:chromosome condensin MukBEF complex kleisin-like MukF subunit
MNMLVMVKQERRSFFLSLQKLGAFSPSPARGRSGHPRASPFLDGAVHSFNLPIRPEVFDLGQPVLNGELSANTVKDMFHGIFDLFAMGELDAAVRQDDTDAIRQRLLEMTQEMSDGQAEGDALGLSDEELAFYDALTRPEAVKDFYQNEELVAMTHELADMLRKNRTIDWQKKKSARASMRRMVKKLLRKHKSPPEGMEDAIATVIGQCEMWTDN